MLDPVRDNQEFAFIQFDDSVAKFDLHSAAPNEKKFILLLVMVPGENALEFYQLHLLTIQLADNLRSPMFAKGAELLGEINLFHRSRVAHGGMTELEWRMTKE